MGVVNNIRHDKWPKQSEELGRETNVTFNYDTTRSQKGVIVRDDAEEPFMTIIKFGNDKFVLATECQYSYPG